MTHAFSSLLKISKISVFRFRLNSLRRYISSFQINYSTVVAFSDANEIIGFHFSSSWKICHEISLETHYRSRHACWLDQRKWIQTKIHTRIYKYVLRLGIQIRKSKIHLNMEALSIDCRNKHWPQCFNRILISSAGSTSICPAIVVQAALDSRAACTTTAEHIEVEPADEIKIRFKHCGQCLFLQYMLSASIFKWIFDFQIWIPSVLPAMRVYHQDLTATTRLINRGWRQVTTWCNITKLVECGWYMVWS